MHAHTLTIIAKETAPADWANTEKLWAAAAQKATGSMETMSSMVTLGRVRISGAPHAKSAYSAPTPSCIVEIVSGKPAEPPAALRESLSVV